MTHNPYSPTGAVRLLAKGDFGKILKQRRGELKINQSDLAGQNGVSRFTIVDAETDRSDPRLSTVIKLLRAVGVTLVAVPSAVADRVTFPHLAPYDPAEDESNGDEMDQLDGYL